ncbi:sulfite oxidase [Actinomadura flavalba]|uniref:sulfite oxidase n=1 Tax=Actinomadura flavalba TaxID=1120938 RepID=UPI00037CE02B|nr:sulfite oxidase [Actinomadura flavalba]
MDSGPAAAPAAALSRRRLFRLSAGAGLALPVLATVPAGTAHAAGPIVKPLPPDLLTPRGTNAETRWDAMRGQGYFTPNDRFFVRNHTSTPRIDASTWRLRLWGTGLRGAPDEARAVEITYEQLRRLPAVTIAAAIECTGNGRSLYTTQQGQTVSGTAWGLGAIGVARWTGVRLSTLLERAGLTRDAVDVLPRGLDDPFTDGGADQGRVRRPLPVAKALSDVIVAYAMNGVPLPPDHGFPARLVVPGWVGIASIKWLGDIEVSRTPLSSPWDTRYYRLFGEGYPETGSAPLTRMNVKSAFELAWNAELDARTQVLHGRSWSGNGPVRRVSVSTDGGRHWRPAAVRLDDAFHPRGWVRWTVPWRPPGPGRHELLARATDLAGTTQPDVARHNTLGYLFGAVARHPVTVK